VSVDGRAVKHGAEHDDTKAGKLLAEEDVLKTACAPKPNKPTGSPGAPPQQRTTLPHTHGD